MRISTPGIVQGLRRFAEAMAEVDPDNAGRYLAESEQYRQALQKAVDRAITLAPVMKVRNGTYRSYIPPIFYIRGPSIGQVVQIAMTDDDWSLELVDSAGIPAADDVRLDGHLDVCEDVLALTPTYLFSGNRFQFLTEKRKESGRSPAEDWFWGGESPQLGYSFLANVYLRRDEISSFLRQWVNNYAAFVMPTPEYCFLEHFMNHADPGQMEAFEKGEFRKYRNGHALSYFMEQFRSLLVWEEGTRPVAGEGDAAALARAGKEDFGQERPDRTSARSPMRSSPTRTTGRSRRRSRCRRGGRPKPSGSVSAIPERRPSSGSRSTASRGTISTRRKKSSDWRDCRAC